MIYCQSIMYSLIFCLPWNIVLSFSIDVSTIIVTSSYRKINSELSLLCTSSAEAWLQTCLVRCSPVGSTELTAVFFQTKPRNCGAIRDGAWRTSLCVGETGAQEDVRGYGLAHWNRFPNRSNVASMDVKTQFSCVFFCSFLPKIIWTVRVVNIC